MLYITLFLEKARKMKKCYLKKFVLFQNKRKKLKNPKREKNIKHNLSEVNRRVFFYLFLF